MIDMGIGQLGGSGVLHKRKFRWTFEVFKQGDNGAQGAQLVPEHFVKTAARPNITIEETEINFLNAKTYIPGKGTWETLTVTYYDVAVQGGTGNEGLWTWLANVYDYTKPVSLKQNSIRKGYAGVGSLKLYDGCGTALEQWTMGDMWPQAVNFGELDYASSEEVTIEVTLRYSNVAYKSLSGCVKEPRPNCESCT
jgi:hypothetical protein